MRVRHGMVRWIVGAGAVLAGMGWGQETRPAGEGPVPVAPSELRKLALQLDDNDYTAREQAHRKLLAYVDWRVRHLADSIRENSPGRKPCSTFIEAYARLPRSLAPELDKALAEAVRKTGSPEATQRADEIRRRMGSGANEGRLNFALLLALTDQPGKPGKDDRPVHVVDSVDSLVKAIGPDRIVRLKPGDYVLSNAVPRNTKHVQWQGMDGTKVEFTIRGVKNLTLLGEAKRPTRLLTAHRHVPVLHIESCQDVTIGQLVLGHFVQGKDCDAGVLHVSKSKQVVVSRCDLFGCGTDGIRATDVEGLAVEASIIRDCGNGIAWLARAKGIRFRRCHFHSNGLWHGLALFRCQDVTVDSCLFENNQSKQGLIHGDGKSIQIRNCLLRDNAAGLTGPSTAKTIRLVATNNKTLR